MERPEPVRVIRDVELIQADPTSGMLRRRAFEAPGLWAGQVVTEVYAARGANFLLDSESRLQASIAQAVKQP